MLGEMARKRRLENKRGGEKERTVGGGESGKIRDVIAEWGESQGV